MSWTITELQKESKVYRIELSSGESLIMIIEECEPTFYIETELKYGYFESCLRKNKEADP